MRVLVVALLMLIGGLTAFALRVFECVLHARILRNPGPKFEEKLGAFDT